MFDDMAADGAGGAGNEDGHGVNPFRFKRHPRN
jgi:hypothetical protein